MFPAGLTTALRTLTILPIPGREAVRRADAIPWFPLAGALIGGVQAVCLWSLSSWPAGAAVLAVVAGLVLTRCLHLDGLGDTADAFGSMGDRDRMLAIMKDPRLGAFGVTAITVDLLVTWVSYQHLATHGLYLTAIATAVAGRTAMADMAASLPCARQDGLGKAFLDGAGIRHRATAWLMALLLCALLGPWMAIILIPAFLIGRILAIRFRRRLGGITGDCLGATQEITGLVLLFALAALASRLAPFAGWYR